MKKLKKKIIKIQSKYVNNKINENNTEKIDKIKICIIFFLL